MTKTYTPGSPIWCSGCGHFGVEAALKQALGNQAIAPHESIVLAGIGCSGTIQNYIGAYGYHALHGRVLPTATGVVAANPGLVVIAAGGDGDGYAIGCGHLVHTFRRNPSLLYIVMNNETYGLTKGQPSPSAAQRADREHAVDAVHLGLTVRGTTFLARGYVWDMRQLVGLMEAGLQHVQQKRGFAFLEVISPCVTFKDSYPAWREVLEQVDGGGGYDPADRTNALVRYAQTVAAGKIPAGLIYQSDATTFEQAAGISAGKAAALQDLSVATHVERYRKQLDAYVM